MKNQAFYVLNERLGGVLNDQVGELYIGGMGVAQGYWRDPQRTEAAFIHHPLLGRLYKTGDMGRYLPDGNIEFLGRIDYQVKINGHRVELGAIESCLLEYPAVRQACVIAVGDKLNKHLAAYIVLRQEYLEANSPLVRAQVEEWHKVHEELASGASQSCLAPPPPHSTRMDGSVVLLENLCPWR